MASPRGRYFLILATRSVMARTVRRSVLRSSNKKLPTAQSALPWLEVQPGNKASRLTRKLAAKDCERRWNGC